MTVTAGLANLTQYERVGIGEVFTVTDGHAHQFQDSMQQCIVHQLPELYVISEQTSQPILEKQFQNAFFSVAGQASAARMDRTLLCYSASQSIDIAAVVLSEAGTTVALLQPCFDNLADILRRHGASLVPLSEAEMTPPRLAQTIAGLAADAVFLTLPNNPTGFALDRASFERLAFLCAAHGKTLIIDWTFRFFDEQPTWDQYEVLERSAVSYICIEDSGKTWPTLELKCSILVASPDMYRPLAASHSDLLLNVSPFTLCLLTQYLADTARRGLEASVRRHIRANRLALRRALTGSVLTPAANAATVSVEWLRIDPDGPPGIWIVETLRMSGIAILPGDQFYWHNPDIGSAFVRVALARDQASSPRRMPRVAYRDRRRAGTPAPGFPMKITCIDEPTYLSDEFVSWMESIGEFVVYDDRPDPDTAIARLSNTDLAIVEWTGLTADVFASVSRVRYLTLVTSSFDFVDVHAASAAGVTVAYCPDYAARAVAEHVFALLLAVGRRLLSADAAVRAGASHCYPPFLGIELHGRTLGLVGTGRIARLVATIAHGFGMRVIAANRRGIGIPGVTLMPTL